MRKGSMDGLRFAAFSRVSTPKQLRGGSHDDQQENLRDIIREGKAVLVEEYGGAEHGTQGWAKPEFDRMLRDAAGGKFNAVIANDYSRFSRDVMRASEAVELFKEKGIRLFMGRDEVDLLDEQDRLMLNLNTSFNDYVASYLQQRMRKGRIKKAQRDNANVIGGRPPWGRTYDKVTQEWGYAVIESPRWTDPRKLMEYVRKQLLDLDRSYEQIGPEVGMDPNTLRRRVAGAGSTWVLKLKPNKYTPADKVEPVTLKIPPLLPDDVVKQMLTRTKAHRLKTTRKHFYPLANLVRCKCGSVLSGHGTTQKSRRNGGGSTVLRYYWHHQKKRQEGCVTGVRAEGLEEAIFYNIWVILRSHKKLTAAIRDALQQGVGMREELEAEAKMHTKKIEEYVRKQDKFLNAIGEEDDAALQRAAKEKFAELEAHKAAARSRLGAIQDQLANDHLSREDEAQLKAQVQAIVAKLARAEGYRSWTDEEKRELALLFVGGPVHGHLKTGVTKDQELSRGIFVEKVQRDDATYWRYTLMGNLAVGAGAVGASDHYAEVERQGPDVVQEPNWQQLASFRELEPITKKQQALRRWSG